MSDKNFSESQAAEVQQVIDAYMAISPQLRGDALRYLQTLGAMCPAERPQLRLVSNAKG
jgi:hypothetical protein